MFDGLLSILQLVSTLYERKRHFNIVYINVITRQMIQRFVFSSAVYFDILQCVMH